MNTSKESYEDLTMEEPNFKAVRESKGFTLNDVFERTRISVANLEAIENGNFHQLPPPVITKSFIKMYAKTLGVDSNRTLARYEQYLESLITPQQDDKRKKTPAPAKVPSKVFLWGFLLFAMVGLVVFFLYLYNSDIVTLKNTVSEHDGKAANTNPPESTKSDVKNETADQSNVAAKPQENVAQLVSGPREQPPDEAQSKRSNQHEKDTAPVEIKKEKKEIAETYQLTMKAKELTWLRITEGQKPPYQIIMKPGEKIQKSASRFIIVVGNAGGIDIEFQGKTLESLGEHGQVVHLKLP